MAAKLGIMGLSRGIALDMARFDVRSNCIAPFAFTRMIESIPAQSEQDKRRIEAFQRMTPEKIAPLAVFLGSDAASGITGQILSVRNNEIYLFNQPRPVKTISRAGGWTPEQIAVELNPAFASLFTPLERSEDVFNWDPI
jgi:NAD(P)-dependent dehydrogenase (short-subunit alcohol dehydrogenase family)